MPKYASSDLNAARWQLVQDRKYSPLPPTEYTALGSRHGRPSSLSHHHLPSAAAAAAAGDIGDGLSGSVPSGLMTTASISLSSGVTMSGSVSARSAKDELRARLSHRPASDPALHHLSHVGKATSHYFSAFLLNSDAFW